MRRSSHVPRRTRWPRVAWALAACVALGTGSAFATGFFASSSTAADPNHGAATPVLKTPPDPDLPFYPGAIRTTNLSIAFDGLWGQLPHDTNVFTVAIPAIDARTGAPYPVGATFAVGVYSTNQPDLLSGAGGHTPWTDLTIQWTIAPCAGGVFNDETTGSPTFAAPTAQAVMPVMSGDIHVALTGLAAGTVYCAGVRQAFPDANYPAGTYITRPYATDADATAANPAWTTAVPVAPLFTALIHRTS